MQLNKLQLDLLEHDYGRRQIMVPRSESAKIYELQSALALKCAAYVEMEAVMEAKAAAIESFKAAVAAVCPQLPPTQPSYQLDPNARPFVLHLQHSTRARARRNRRQRSDCRPATALTSHECPAGNSKQRRAASRQPKQEAWLAANKAEPSQHGGAYGKDKVHGKEVQSTSTTPSPQPIDRAAAVADTKSAHSDAAELALAASRERCEARREAQAQSDKWCGPTPTSVFDVPSPPRSFIDGWFSWHTPRMGGAEFGAQKLNLRKPLERRPHWTVLGQAVRFDDRDGVFGAPPMSVEVDEDGLDFLGLSLGMY